MAAGRPWCCLIAAMILTGAAPVGVAAPAKRSAPPTVRNAPPRPAMEAVDWFSYRSVGRSAYGMTAPRPVLEMPSGSVAALHGFDGVAEEIVVIGERNRRDFALTRPSDELTGPRALDAAQPYVPWPGATCTYKNLCYDLSQPPLRAVLAKLLGG